MPSKLEFAVLQEYLGTFRHMLLNRAEITENLGNHPLRGGNYGITHIPESERRIKFKGHDLVAAVKYNRNNLAEYLADNNQLKYSLYSLFEAVDKCNKVPNNNQIYLVLKI